MTVKKELSEVAAATPIVASDPGASDVHVDTTDPSAKPNTPASAVVKKIKVDNPHFTRKLGDILKDHVQPDVFASAVVVARAHAGGKVKAERQQAAKAQADADQAGTVADDSVPNDPTQMSDAFGLPPVWDDADEYDDGEDDDDDEPLKEKATVNYKAATEVGHQCGACMFFDADDNECSLVEGRIDPAATCDLFEPATGSIASAEGDPAKGDAGVLAKLRAKAKPAEDAEKAAQSQPQPVAKAPPGAAGAAPVGTPTTPPAKSKKPANVDNTGAMTSSEPRDVIHLCASGAPTTPWGEPMSGKWRLFLEGGLAFSTGAGTYPDWIPYLPKPGTFIHVRYGEMSITRERNDRFIQNFNDRVYQYPLPLDAEHESKLSGAVAWIYALRTNSDGSADAKVQWTTRGKAFLDQGAFKFISPEWFEEWTQPDTGKVFRDVVIGGAMTVRPYFKERSLRPLVASEAGLAVGRVIRDAKDPTSWTLGFTTMRPVAAAHRETKETPMSAPNANATGTGTGTAPPEGQRTFAEMEAELRSYKEQAAKATADATKASEAVAKLTADARIKRFGDIANASPTVRPGGKPWVGDLTKKVAFVEKLAVTFGEDSDDVKDYITEQNSTAERMAASDLFAERGRDGTPTSGSATGKAEEIARKYREADPTMTIERARAKVWNEHPDLYVEHEREQERKLKSASRY